MSNPDMPSPHLVAMADQMSRTAAGLLAEILRQPITLDKVRALTGKSGESATEASIAARLAEVTP